MNGWGLSGSAPSPNLSPVRGGEAFLSWSVSQGMSRISYETPGCVYEGNGALVEVEDFEEAVDVVE